MKIQVNTSNNITATEAFQERISSTITDALKRFDEQVTRVEVHFSDNNGKKTGPDDKSCNLEVRLEGMQPIMVSKDGDTLDHALKGALDKMKVSLDSAIGKLNKH